MKRLVVSTLILIVMPLIVFADQKSQDKPQATAKATDVAKAPAKIPLTPKQAELIRQQESIAKDMANRYASENQHIQGEVQGLLKGFAVGTALEDKQVCQQNQQGQISNAPCFLYQSDEKGVYSLVEVLPPSPPENKTQPQAQPQTPPKDEKTKEPDKPAEKKSN